MALDPWYKIATPRKEVREGRSFNPDEFAIALEQVVAGTAPEDYREPEKFFSRTCFTRALRDHSGLVLRRLAGETANTAPVLTLITQFGGGKTHTLTALHHIASHGDAAKKFPGVGDLATQIGLSSIPKAKVVVFVGNAWDPKPGRETPWMDIAWQIAGDAGVRLLGPDAKQVPPGTETLAEVFRAAKQPVLVLMDEVLNFLDRNKRRDPGIYDAFQAFIQNLTVALTGLQHCAALISLPRSQVEMSAEDQQWQEKITKVVKRVAKDLIVADEAEIGEVIRRRLFEDLGNERIRKRVAKEFADWCFERRARLPPEWTAVDTASTETKARELLQQRFETCYPFHPATLSVFQRKWQSLQMFQQTRGTLAMFAQWISYAHKNAFQQARNEPLITLGSAPLDAPDFRSMVLGQLGETRLLAAIGSDIADAHSHARALDADTKGPLRDIHRRVGTAIFFESSGGQTDKSAHLPELRFALGDPMLDTTSIDNAALALEARAYYMRRVGTDGFRIGYQPTLKKVVNDRRASLDPDAEVKPAIQQVVRAEFDRGRSIPWTPFPADGSEVTDTPKLSLVVLDPAFEYRATDTALRQKLAEWTKQRGSSPRSYPAALVWCLKKPGRELVHRMEEALAWRRVKREIDEGTLGGEFDKADRAELTAKVKDAEGAVVDEVWASYRFVAVADAGEPEGIRVIDLGSGHASAGTTLCGRIIEMLKAESLLNESVGAGYIERNWPPALKTSGAWPLSGLRQSFLNGALTRLLDPDSVLKGKVCEFVGKGDFGFGSGQKPDGTYERVWFEEILDPADVTFDKDVFLLTKTTARMFRSSVIIPPEPFPPPEPLEPGPGPEPGPAPGPALAAAKWTVRVEGSIPPEVWNRVGTKLLPKLRMGEGLTVHVGFSTVASSDVAKPLIGDLEQILKELGVSDTMKVSSEN
ncbi:MAG: AAA family ATPase [Betaproteobacteria bacterium RIFCSPLOWO2_12_FULL_62_13]|nr:MAG: AAA family ATPase [Betaproteobacteria bacterium RIFCSPLOWO2_12_FULL_62_13]